MTASDYHEQWTYQGGAFCLGFNLHWAFGLQMDTMSRKRDQISNYETLVAEAGRAPDKLGEHARFLPLRDLPVVADTGAAGYYRD